MSDFNEILPDDKGSFHHDLPASGGGSELEHSRFEIGVGTAAGRLSGVLSFSAALFSVGVFFIFSQLSIHAQLETPDAPDSAARVKALTRFASHLDFVRICDTVYVVGERFIEVDLAAQHATLRYRNGDSLKIPISSGHITNDGGIKTPTGLFSIQNKTPLAISRQFGNTKMLHWIGFNYNVGFHGLEQNGYYRYLGKQPSSHGCVRVGREDVAALYKRVSEGDPVLVFDAPPARILAFADTLEFDTTQSLRLGSRSRISGKFMDERLQNLYDGELLARRYMSLYIPRALQLRPGGYAVGWRDSLQKPQQRPAAIAVAPIPVASDRLRFASDALARRIALEPPPVSVDSLSNGDIIALPENPAPTKKPAKNRKSPRPASATS
jgi:hypothetical protein